MTAWKRREVIGNATLYLGDCIEVLHGLRDGCQNVDVSVEQGGGADIALPTRIADAVITDPPYGIDFKYESHDDNEADWFVLMDKVVPLMRASAPFVVMPNCRMQAMKWWMNNHEPDWIIAWYKGSPGHRSKIGFNDWEPHLVWGKPPKQMHDFFQTPLVIDRYGHPCEKPLAYSTWLVERGCVKGGTVCDPFMGSGTTGAAAVKLERKFIGIEIEPKYFDIACERIENAQRQGRMFA